MFCSRLKLSVSYNQFDLSELKSWRWSFYTLYILIKYNYFKCLHVFILVSRIRLYKRSHQQLVGIMNSVKDNNFQLDFLIFCLNILFCILNFM